MNAGRLGSWISSADSSIVRRISWATSLLVVATTLLLMLATALPAQTAPDSRSCGRSVPTPLAGDLAIAGVVIAGELQSMTREGSWRTMSQPVPMRIAADPSSHLHALGSYHLARRATGAFAQCGRGDRAVLAGAAWSLAIGVTKELVDGWYTGFSTVDLAVDAAGVAYAVAQQKIPVLEHVTPTFSATPRVMSGGARSAVTNYAQQTVWLSANVHEMLPAAAAKVWPAAMRLSAGRRAFGGAASSEYVVGLDIDAARLPGSHPAWVRIKSALHNVRLPGPAVVMSARGTHAFGLYW